MFPLQRVMLCLYRFTRYQYQLEVHNDVGNTSGEIVTAVTMAGVPLHPPSLSASTINHTAIQVNWTQPCKINLLLVLTVQERFWNSQRLAQGHAFIVWCLCCPVCLKESDSRDWKYLFLWLTYHSFLFLLISFLALQDLQGTVEYFFLTVESPEPSLILTFTPEITSAVISDLWPSTTYLVSLQVSNGAHNTSKAVVNVTTADGSMCIFYYHHSAHVLLRLWLSDFEPWRNLNWVMYSFLGLYTVLWEIDSAYRSIFSSSDLK